MGGAPSFFLERVRDLVRRPPVTCPGTASAGEVARLLTRERVGSVVVVDAAGAPLGIVTDRDLRQKILGEARDPATPAAAIMSAPLVTTRPAAFTFDALLEMTRRNIRHLVVLDEGRLAGVLSARDLLDETATQPVLLSRDISRAVSLDVLAGLADRVTALVRRLVDEGGSAYDIGQLVAELNDRMVVRVLDLAAAALDEAGLRAPVPYCWLTFGSEARREQTLRTDQDNGLVYADPPADLATAAAEYYARFATVTIDGLVAIGFPRCPGDVMASNPRWCQPMSAWTRYLLHCMDEPLPERVLGAAIHFDVRPLAGALELGTGLVDLVRGEAPAHRLFLALLARDVVDRRLPVTMLGHLAVTRRGSQAGTIDVKTGGTMQLVGAGRVLALELGLAERNTIERVRAASTRGVWREAEARDVEDACQLLMRVRLVHQLEQLAAGTMPDNRIAPARLTRADALLLRDALRTIAAVQRTVRGRYPEGIG
jgi:CBS domain-containing protein